MNAVIPGGSVPPPSLPPGSALAAPMLYLARVCAAEKKAARAGAIRGVLIDVSMSLYAGVAAICGTPDDGTQLLFDVIDGSARSSKGTCRVTQAGFAVGTGAARRLVARVDASGTLPEDLRVRQVCELEAAFRHDTTTSPEARLGSMGLSSLWNEPVRRLSLEERRAVQMALALTSQVATILLLEDPLRSLGPLGADRVVAAVREAGQRGRLVLMTTTSVHDAQLLADVHGIMARGVLRWLPPGLNWDLASMQGACSLRITFAPEISKAAVSTLVARLAASPWVTGLTLRTDAGLALLVSGPNRGALATEATNAIAATLINVLEVSTEPGSLAELSSIAAQTPHPTEVRV